MLAADNTAGLCSRCYREQRDQLRTPPAQPRNEFFETDEFRAAFQGQHIGKVLKAYRNHPRHLQLFGKALNQELLGRWLGLTQAQVSKLETGKPEQNLETLRNYARILHLPQHLLWFDFPGQSRLTSPQPPDATDKLIVPASPNDILATTLEQASDDAAARFETAIRAGLPFAGNCGLPELGRSAALQDVEEAVSVAAHESIELLAWAEVENVGELTLEQLHSEVRRISHAYLKAPTAPLFRRTCQLRDRAFTLLDGRHGPCRARDLYVAAGWSLTVLAWMSVDLGRPDAGEDHARTAWLCAERAEHDGLRAWVRATQHTAAFWQDDLGRAAQYAADGLCYATGSAALFLASAHALDLARSGQDERAREALLQAQQFAETVEQSSDALAGPFTCSLDRASGFWSDTHLALGAAHAAIEDADRAIAAFEAQPLERRNQGSERMVRLQKARGHLALGQLDDAEDALMPVLDTAPEHRMRPLLVRVNDVYTAAAKPELRHEPIAKRIRDAATAFK